MSSAWPGTSCQPGGLSVDGGTSSEPSRHIDVGPDTLFVCFVANAECACHLALGWPLPTHILDLNPEFRCLINGRTSPEGKGLLGALRDFNLDTISPQHKDAMRRRVMQGWPFSLEERSKFYGTAKATPTILCRLLPKILPCIKLDVALYRGEFAAISARMEHRGVPIDMSIFPRLQDKQAWAAVRDAMVPAIDAQYGVYVRGKDGDWSFNNELFGNT